MDALTENTPTGKGGLRGVLTPMLQWTQFANAMPPPAWPWDPVLTKGDLDTLMVNRDEKSVFLKSDFSKSEWAQ